MHVRRIAGLLALIGATAWAVKLSLIVANGGSNLDQGLVGAMYLLGVTTLLAAGAALGVALTQRRALWLRVPAAVVGAVSVMLLYFVLDAVGKAAVGDAGPAWLPDEVGIGLMVVAALVAAAVLLRRRTAVREPVPTPRRSAGRPVRGERTGKADSSLG